MQPGRYAPPCASTNVYEEWVSMTLPDVPSECSVRTTSHTFASAAGASSDGKVSLKNGPKSNVQTTSLRIFEPSDAVSCVRDIHTASSSHRTQFHASPLSGSKAVTLATGRVHSCPAACTGQKSQYNYKPQQSQACPFHIEPPCLHLAAQNTHTAALPEKIIVLPGPGHKSPRVKAPSRSVKTGNCVSPPDVFSFCA